MFAGARIARPRRRPSIRTDIQYHAHADCRARRPRRAVPDDPTRRRETYRTKVAVYAFFVTGLHICKTARRGRRALQGGVCVLLLVVANGRFAPGARTAGDGAMPLAASPVDSLQSAAHGGRSHGAAPTGLAGFFRSAYSRRRGIRLRFRNCFRSCNPPAHAEGCRAAGLRCGGGRNPRGSRRAP